MDDFEFDKQLNNYFGSDRGAGSRVTAADEAKKGQITVTAKYEKPIFEDLIAGIPTGKKETLGDSCVFNFKLYPSGNTIRLPLLYRHDRPSELRLYMNAGAFKPPANVFWFAFEKSGELWLGALTEFELEKIREGVPFDEFDGLLGETDDDFQDRVNGNKPPNQKTSTVTAYQRDPEVARKVLIDSGYKCEVTPNLKTFVSRATGKPYVEAHHFVPMFWQRHYPDRSLDVPANICILNPFTHKLIHHGQYQEVDPILEKLAEKRSDLLKDLGMGLGDLKDIYAGLVK